MARLASPSFLTPGSRDAGQVALDVGGEHRHAGSREAFGQHLQRHRLAGAGGAGDQAVAVGELELQVLRLDAAAEEDLALLHQAFALNHGALLASARPDAPLLNYMSTSGWQSRGAAYRAKKQGNLVLPRSLLADPTPQGPARSPCDQMSLDGRYGRTALPQPPRPADLQTDNRRCTHGNDQALIRLARLGALRSGSASREWPSCSPIEAPRHAGYARQRDVQLRLRQPDRLRAGRRGAAGLQPQGARARSPNASS